MHPISASRYAPTLEHTYTRAADKNTFYYLGGNLDYSCVAGSTALSPGGGAGADGAGEARVMAT